MQQSCLKHASNASPRRRTQALRQCSSLVSHLRVVHFTPFIYIYLYIYKYAYEPLVTGPSHRE
jgi:hypothetical protein